MIKTLTLISSTLVLTACGGNLAPNSGKLLQPEVVYEVDAWGTNPDIIEFIPEGDKSKLCLIVVTGSDQAAGITCFDKREENQ